MKPRNRTPRRKLREFLIRLNKDLLIIDEKIKTTSHLHTYDDLHFYIMALEDRRFLIHGGVDFRSVFREIWKFISFQRCGGASTIDMQMVRTITNFREKTISRKFYEIILAYLINHRYSKEQILSCYLDNAFFGSRLTGINKVLESFNVSDISSLTEWQKALIAASLQKPKPLNPCEKWKNLIADRALYAQRVRSRVIENSKN